MNLRRVQRYCIFLIYSCTVFFFALIVYANLVVLVHSSTVYHQVSEVPTTTVTLVLGGGMRAPGIMSDMQTDRVLQAVALYKAGKTSRIIMSGDDGALRDNEVDFMRLRAIDEGVPEEAIEIDPHAYRTYLTCYRAKHEYQINEVLVITQNFHLPRTIYMCDDQGIKTTGLSADLREHYSGMWKVQIREVLARVKAVWQTHITKPDK